MTTPTRDLTAYAQNETERPLLEVLSTPETMRRFELACGRKAGEVVINIINAASLSPLIYKCVPDTVVTAALNAATLRLSLAPSLGQACILPFKKNFKVGNNWQSEYRAQLVVMVRGVKDLAMRTNKYRALNDFKVYEGQSIEEDQMTGRKCIIGTRKSDKVIGYGAYMCLTSGYEHTVYWETEKVLAHAKRYSPTYDAKEQKFNDKSRWVTDFEQQAAKTVVKDLIMNHGVISEDDRAQLAALDNERADGDIIQGESEFIDDAPRIETPEPAPRHTEKENFEALFGKDPEPAPMTLETARARLTPKGSTYDDLTMEQLETIIATTKVADNHTAASLVWEYKRSQLPEAEVTE